MFYVYLLVKEQEKANSVFQRFETRLSQRRPRAGAELGSFTSFSVCMFKLRFVFVRSGAGGREGQLGSIWLSVRRCSLNLSYPVRFSYLPLKQWVVQFDNEKCYLLNYILLMCTPTTTLNLSLRLVFECFKLYWIFKLARLKNRCND